LPCPSGFYIEVVGPVSESVTEESPLLSGWGGNAQFYEDIGVFGVTPAIAGRPNPGFIGFGAGQEASELVADGEIGVSLSPVFAGGPSDHEDTVGGFVEDGEVSAYDVGEDDGVVFTTGDVGHGGVSSGKGWKGLKPSTYIRRCRA